MPDSFPPERPGLLRRLWGGGPEKTKTFRLPVNAYGKLPIYKDFISSGLTEPAAREFRAWLDKGFSHRWATDEGCRDAEIPPCNFLMRLPDSRGCAAGSLWGSSDEGGLRKFPFALFLSFPAAHGAADPIAAVEYLGDLERRASELRFLFGPGASLSSFYQAYRGAELDIPIRSREQVSREFRSELAGFSIGDFAESVLGSRAAGAWPQLLAATTAAAESAGALRLPLGGRLPRAREVEFWLLWLDRQDAKRRRPVTGVLYPHGHNPGRAIFFFRDVVPEDFLLFHPTRTDLPKVYEALAHVPEAAEPVVFPPRRTESVPSAAPGSVPPAAAASAPSAAAVGAPPPAAESVPPAAAEPVKPVTELAAEPASESPAAPAPAPAAAVVESGSGPGILSSGSDENAVAAAPAAADAASMPKPEDSPASAEAAAAAESAVFLEEAPFPEAERPVEPTASGRLSQILSLDRLREDSLSAAESSPPENPPAEPVAAASEAPSPAAGAPVPEAPAAESSPPENPPAEPFAAASEAPAPAVRAPATEVPAPAAAAVAPARRESTPPPPDAAPAAPAPPVATPRPAPTVPLPAGWDRPLPSLLEG